MYSECTLISISLLYNTTNSRCTAPLKAREKIDKRIEKN